MKKLLWLVTLLPVLGLAVVFIGSEIKLRSYESPQAFNTVLNLGQASLDRGKHAMRIRGCFGCHGQQLQGRVFDEQWPWVKRAVAPNLSIYARQHDVATIERAIRHGIGADDKAMFSMPSYNFTLLKDEDLTVMIAYMRSAAVIDQPLPAPSLGWQARWDLLVGSYQHAATMASQVPGLVQDAQQPQLARGEYLAMTTCNECHGLDLKGEQLSDFTTPDLTVMIKAYSVADFRRLMATGTAIGERENLGLMSVVAKDRFAYFSEQELEDLYAYLRQRSNQD